MLTRAIGNLWRYWASEIEHNWWIAGVLVVWFINAGLNGFTGYEVGGPFIAGAFIAIAAIGAGAATMQAATDDVAKRSFFLLLVLFQLALGQWAGWQTISLALERGATRFEDKADTRRTLKDDLAKWRAERDQIGILTMTVEEARSKQAVEKKKVSARYPNGEGPEWQKARAAEARALRARKLDDLIREATAAKQSGAGGKVDNSDVLYEVPVKLLEMALTWYQGKPVAVSADDVRFGFLVFIVALLEFIATLGFWVFGMRVDGRQGRMPAPANDAFDPAELPPAQLMPPPRRPAIAASRVETGRARPSGHPAGGAPEARHEIHQGQPGAGGSSTTVVNVGGPEPVRQNLPPRIAARRAG